MVVGRFGKGIWFDEVLRSCVCVCVCGCVCLSVCWLVGWFGCLDSDLGFLVVCCELSVCWMRREKRRSRRRKGLSTQDHNQYSAWGVVL